jgi:hypothetical protein
MNCFAFQVKDYEAAKILIILIDPDLPYVESINIWPLSYQFGTGTSDRFL